MRTDRRLCWLAVVAVLAAMRCLVGAAGEGEVNVTLHLLDHTDEKKTASRFWLDWNDRWRGIVESKKITGDRAEEIIAKLRRSLLPEESTNFCGHDPIYGIEAVAADGKVLKTSLCFKCVTWVQPKKRLTIAGKPGAGNALCRLLREELEIPEELRKESN